jgi:putative membrane protein
MAPIFAAALASTLTLTIAPGHGPGLALLAQQAAPIPPFAWTSWAGAGPLRAGLLFLAGIYLLGIGPLRTRYRLGPPASKKQIASYLSGVLILLIALEGPIHELSDTYLFSMHMVQHMLLIYAAPPLMLLGIPEWLLRPVIRLPGVFPVVRWLTKPLPAIFLFNVIFTLFHIPLYYNTIVENEPLHIAAHLLFIVLAFITWWPILSPLPELPRLHYALRMIYIFGQTFSGFIVGAFVTNAPTVLYTVYEQAPRTWGLSALDDQKLGGLIMWIIGGTYLLAVYSAVFFAWANAEGVHDDVAQPLRRRVRVTPPEQAVGTSEPTLASVTTPAAPPPDPEPSPTPGTGTPGAFGERHVVIVPPDRSRLN